MGNVSLIQIIIVLLFIFLLFGDVSKLKKKIISLKKKNFDKNKRS